MGYITYKQADSRWGSKNYNGSSFYGRLGMSMLEYFKISAYLKEEVAAKIAAKPVVVKEVVPVTIDDSSYTLGGKVFPIKNSVVCFVLLCFCISNARSKIAFPTSKSTKLRSILSLFCLPE